MPPGAVNWRKLTLTGPKVRNREVTAIHPVANTPRGYIAMGGEALSYASEQEAPPDLKEFYHCGRGPWPSAQANNVS